MISGQMTESPPNSYCVGCSAAFSVTNILARSIGSQMRLSQPQVSAAKLDEYIEFMDKVEMLQQLPAEGPLRALLCHYGSDPAQRKRLMAAVQDKVLSMVGQVAHFFEDVFGDYPFVNLHMVEPRRGGPLPTATRLKSAPTCNLDPGISRKINAIYPTAEDVANCPEFRAVLLNWGRTGRPQG